MKERTTIDYFEKKGIRDRRRSDFVKAGEKENATESTIVTTKQTILPSISSTF